MRGGGVGNGMTGGSGTEVIENHGIPGPVEGSQLPGGPLVMSGHGGRISVRVDITPPGPVTVVVIGGRLILATGVKVLDCCPELTLTFE